MVSNVDLRAVRIVLVTPVLIVLVSPMTMVILVMNVAHVLPVWMVMESHASLQPAWISHVLKVLNVLMSVQT